MLTHNLKGAPAENLAKSNIMKLPHAYMKNYHCKFYSKLGTINFKTRLLFVYPENLIIQNVKNGENTGIIIGTFIISLNLF